MSVMGMLRQQPFSVRRQALGFSLTFRLDSAYDCNYLELDRANTTEHNAWHVLGTSALSPLPGTRFGPGFLREHSAPLGTEICFLMEFFHP
jgi:hypothetical protein